MDHVNPEAHVKFFKAADEIVAGGGRATLRAVLERAGVGSMRDITTAMQLWRARGQPLAEVSATAPESLLASVEQLWRAAYEKAMARVGDERRALAAATAAAQSQVEEVTALAELFESQRDTLATQLAEVTRERDGAKERVVALDAQLRAHQQFFEEKLKAMLSKAPSRKAPRTEKKAS
jgi:chromosome segregation ATPase